MPVLSAAVQLGNQQQLGLEELRNSSVNILTFVVVVVTNIFYVAWQIFAFLAVKNSVLYMLLLHV